MNSVIKVIDLYKHFQTDEIRVDILQGINLTISKGEFVSLMGPSGSGKSTLLYLIGGLDLPTSGKVTINGQDINNMRDFKKSKIRRRDIGLVFQFYNLIQNLTVEENILLPIVMDGKSKNDYKEKLEELLYMIGLQDKKKRFSNQLSGGEQQRVSIARAVITEPSIILADEATGNLDNKTSEAIMDLFVKIVKEKNIAILQVTHSQDIAEYADRIIRLRDGKIVEKQ